MSRLSSPSVTHFAFSCFSDKVDADLRALTAMENSKQRSNSSSNSKSVPKWRFTYHRVTSPQFQANQSRKSNVPAKAFAAISLANIPFREGNEQQQPQQSSIPTPQENEGEEVEEAAKMSGSYGLKGSVINYRKSENGAMKNTIVDSLGQGKWKSAGEYHYQMSEKDGLKESYGSPRVTEKSESQSGSSRSRTQLEEEIAKMSLSHHNNEGSNVAHPSFHWRPWIHTQNSYNDNYHYNRNSKMNPKPSTPTTTTEETTTPKPSTTAPVLSSNGNNDDHTETWSQVLQDFHDQLHKTRFSNHHHHHHENEKRENHHRRYHHHPRLELQEDQKQEQQSIQSVITNKADESNELPTDSEELRQRYRHHSRPELHKISDEPSVDPAFTKHPSWTLEYKI